MLIALWYKFIRNFSSLHYPGSPFWRTVIYQAPVMAADVPLISPGFRLNSMATNGHRGHCALPTNDLLWKWWDAINFLAKRRFKDENLTLAAADYVLEKLSQNCTRIAGKSDSFVYVVISNLLEDFHREKFGHPRMPAWITKKPLYHEVMQIIRQATGGTFNCQTAIKNLHQAYPSTPIDDLVDTVLTIKAYYLLIVFDEPHQETLKILQTTMPDDVAKSVLENIITTVLSQCSPRLKVVFIPWDGDLDDGDNHEQPSPEEKLLQEYLCEILLKWIRDAAVNENELDPILQGYLKILRSVPLREEEKRILVMRYYDNMSAQAIANSEFGQTHHLTDRRIFKIAHTAPEKLRKHLKIHGYMD